MRTIYSPDINAQVSEDDSKKVRHIRHSQEARLSDASSPEEAAHEYLRDIAGTLQIPLEQLQSLHTRAQNAVPREQGVEFRLREEKRLADSSTLAYAQTFLDVPVWRRGLSVKIKQAPTRVISVTDNSEPDLRGELPGETAIARYSELFESIPPPRDRARRKAAMSREAAALLRALLGAAATRSKDTRIMSGEFYVYRFDPARRFAGAPEPPERGKDGPASLEEGPPPFIDVPPVSGDIEPGRAYVVAQLIIHHGGLVWLLLVELETRSVLYLECMTLGVNGMVFKRDPMVSSGDLTVTAGDGDAVLQNHDSDEVLNSLDPPSGGNQSLAGTFVVLQNEEGPNIAPPTRATGADFDFTPRTNEFAAVNAYFHMTELFRTIEGLGFVIVDYFDGTTFPIPVDHRGMSGSAATSVNAHWSPNGAGGTDHMCFALCDTTNTAQPLGRAVDPWVHWHEMGGHGTLGDHVGQGNLGFAHSAGDGLAAIQMDPESALRALPERFRYAPFRPFTVERRFDRTGAAWAWGSPVVLNANGVTLSGDDEAYGSEQILATCHFRLYRSIGGDHADVGRRRFAARAATYLILRTIQGLTVGTNPSNFDPVLGTDVVGRGAELWCEAMQDSDLENWTSEGLAGGAYNKVIRWAFEEPGTYGGEPPAVDVHIDDGRGGEYPFQPVHWHNASMWNRHDPDGLAGHQNAIAGATNHMYVTLKNRGTTAATDVQVTGHHCLPGAGLTWPTDFTPMAPPATGLPVASIGPDNSDAVTVGPFAWVPNENVYGHDCVLMIATCPGDPSNVDHLTGSETMEEWRLVPNDNNIGQRNVTIEPGESESLEAALDGAVFVAGNSFNRTASMEIRVTLPRFLVAKGWRIDLGDAAKPFRLKPGQKRHVRFKLVRGKDFSAREIRAAKDRDIRLDLFANGMTLGGMIYRVDPGLKERVGGERRRG